MLGWTTLKSAKRQGYTHRGWYYFIPVYIKDIDCDFVVLTKWLPLQYLMEPVSCLEGFFRSVFYPDDEPMFQFNITEIL